MQPYGLVNYEKTLSLNDIELSDEQLCQLLRLKLIQDDKPFKSFIFEIFNHKNIGPITYNFLAESGQNYEIGAFFNYRLDLSEEVKSKLLNNQNLHFRDMDWSLKSFQQPEFCFSYLKNLLTNNYNLPQSYLEYFLSEEKFKSKSKHYNNYSISLLIFNDIDTVQG
jgi:hypothetical protein